MKLAAGGKAVPALAALVVALLAVGVWAAPATPARSFAISSFTVEAELLPDASMTVVEHITYDFDGAYTTGVRPIPPGEGYEIVDMRVTENGAPVPFEGAPHNLTWRYAAEDESRTFDVSYRVLGAADVGPDVGELYWKWVGTDHSDIGYLRVTLRTPGDGTDVRVWGHGPLTGQVTKDGATATWLAGNGVPAGAFVEGRVAVPSTAFTVDRVGDARLPGIVAEETRLAADANRSRARETAQRSRINRWLWLVPVLGWIVYLLVWREWGREPEVTSVGEYVREPLDDPPAVVQALLSWGEVEPLAFSATVVDLAQRGALTISEERKDRFLLADKVDWRFRAASRPPDLRPFETSALDRLFEGGPETTQSELQAWAKGHQTEARSWWSEWKADVDKEVKARGYLRGGRAGPFALNVLTAFAVGAAGVAALGNGAWIGVLVIASALAQLVATIWLRQRTPPGAQRAQEWQAFRHFLEDFSQLGDAPVGHLVLWERFLVYAVALGVSDDVAKGLAVRVPPEEQSTFAPWYGGGFSGGGGSFGSMSHFADGFTSTVQSSFASTSSGSGSGGGFSGGGGGGGGGGGVGAS